MKKTEVDEFRKTLRSGAILIIYNLVEGTVSMAMEAIGDAIVADGATLHDVRPSIQYLVLRGEVTQLVRDGAGEGTVERAVYEMMTDLALGRCLRPPKRRGFSGNVNADRMRKHGSRFGFRFGSDRKLRGGEALERVRLSRNKLAHGIAAFSEVGRDLSVVDLVAIETQVCGYLLSYIEEVERYLSSKMFRSEVLLREVRGVGPHTLSRLIAEFGSATSVLQASRSRLEALGWLRETTLNAIVEAGGYAQNATNLHDDE